MGVAVAENLAALVTEKSIPAPQAVLLCGDLYDYPDCHKRGGTGPVDDVYAAFSDFVPHVIGVHGNHGNLANGDSLPGNTVILDGQAVIYLHRPYSFLLETFARSTLAFIFIVAMVEVKEKLRATMFSQNHLLTTFH